MHYTLITTFLILVLSSCNHKSNDRFAQQGTSITEMVILPPISIPEAAKGHIPYYDMRPLPDSIIAKYNFGKIFPVDEAYKDQSLLLFIDSLSHAARTKDFSFLMNHFSDTVFKGYATGMPETAAAFRQYWMDKNGVVSNELWSEMNRALNLGGIFLAKEKDYPFYGHEIYQIPYLVFPWEISDMFMSQATIAEKVPVYEKKDTTSPIVGYLNYDIVDVNYEESGIEPLFEGVTTVSFNQMEWVKISTLNRKLSGYVDGKFLYAPLGLHIYLEKIKGNWRIRGIAIGE